MSTITHRAIRTGVIAAAAGLAIAGITPALAASWPAIPHAYSFRTVDNANDRTFNELLGINNTGRIAGFYGSGAPGHPSKGYLLSKPYGQSDYHPVHYPGSAQTEVTGLNDTGVSVGIFANSSGAHFGFYLQNGGYHKVRFPTGNNSNPPFNELLGINNGGLAVGDFTDAGGFTHAYRYSIVTHRFFRINVRNSANVTATAINGGGTIVGFFINARGQTVAFLRHPNGTLATLSKGGADLTQAFGISGTGLVVGTYTVGSLTYGFTWRPGQTPHTVSDPSGVGTTFINGVNKAGDLVGFYTDSRGRVNGLLATP